MSISCNSIATTQLQLLLRNAVSQYLSADIFRSILMIDVRHMFTLINIQKIDDLLNNDLLKDRFCNIVAICKRMLFLDIEYYLSKSRGPSF